MQFTVGYPTLAGTYRPRIQMRYLIFITRNQHVVNVNVTRIRHFGLQVAACNNTGGLKVASNKLAWQFIVTYFHVHRRKIIDISTVTTLHKLCAQDQVCPRQQ